MDDNKLQPSDYYDIRNALSYGFLYTIVVSLRSYGKTFSTKSYIYNKYKKSLSKYNQGKRNFPSRFVYIRRFAEELDDASLEFWDALKDKGKLDGIDMEYKKGSRRFYCNGQLMGYAIPLSRASKLKGIEFPSVDVIFMDEYQIDTTIAGNRYLTGEGKALYDLCSTIIREREGVRVILLANNISMINPINVQFGFTRLPKPNTPIKNHKKNAIFIFSHNDTFVEKIQNTQYGASIKDTEYGKYSQESKLLNDSDVFIEKRSTSSRCKYILKYSGKMYGVWEDYSIGRTYMSDKYDKGCQLIFTITQADHEVNTMLISSNNVFLKSFKERYMTGVLRFENQRVKKDGEEILKLIAIR